MAFYKYIFHLYSKTILFYIIFQFFSKNKIQTNNNFILSKNAVYVNQNKEIFLVFPVNPSFFLNNLTLYYQGIPLERKIFSVNVSHGNRYELENYLNVTKQNEYLKDKKLGDFPFIVNCTYQEHEYIINKKIDLIWFDVRNVVRLGNEFCGLSKSTGKFLIFDLYNEFIEFKGDYNNSLPTTLRQIFPDLNNNNYVYVILEDLTFDSFDLIKINLNSGSGFNDIKYIDVNVHGSENIINRNNNTYITSFLEFGVIYSLNTIFLFEKTQNEINGGIKEENWNRIIKQILIQCNEIKFQLNKIICEQPHNSFFEIVDESGNDRIDFASYLSQGQTVIYITIIFPFGNSYLSTKNSSSILFSLVYTDKDKFCIIELDYDIYTSQILSQINNIFIPLDIIDSTPSTEHFLYFSSNLYLTQYYWYNNVSKKIYIHTLSPTYGNFTSSINIADINDDFEQNDLPFLINNINFYGGFRSQEDFIINIELSLNNWIYIIKGNTIRSQSIKCIFYKDGLFTQNIKLNTCSTINDGINSNIQKKICDTSEHITYYQVINEKIQTFKLYNSILLSSLVIVILICILIILFNILISRCRIIKLDSTLLRTKDDQETIKLINNDIQMIKKLEEKESNTSGYPLQHANMKDNDKTQNRILTKLNQNIMYEKPL